MKGPAAVIIATEWSMLSFTVITAVINTVTLTLDPCRTKVQKAFFYRQLWGVQHVCTAWMRRSRSSTSKVCGFMWLRCSNCFSKVWWSMILPENKINMTIPVLGLFYWFTRSLVTLHYLRHLLRLCVCNIRKLMQWLRFTALKENSMKSFKLGFNTNK